MEFDNEDFIKIKLIEMLETQLYRQAQKCIVINILEKTIVAMLFIKNKRIL